MAAGDGDLAYWDWQNITSADLNERTDLQKHYSNLEVSFKACQKK